MRKLVIFDHDGLMVNSEHVVFAALRDIFGRYGHDFAWDYYCTSIGLPVAESIARYLRDIPIGVPYDDFFAERDALVREYMETRLALMPGLVELLDELARHGVPMAIATSGARAYIARNLDRFGIARYFSAIACIDDVARGKPHPDLILKALEMMGARPEEAIMLEDSPHGVEAARRAGVRCIAVPTAGIAPARFAGAAVAPNLLAARPLLLDLLTRGR